MGLAPSLIKKIRAKNKRNVFELETFWFILKPLSNEIDNGLRINRNVSNSNMFHIFLDLIYLIKQ